MTKPRPIQPVRSGNWGPARWENHISTDFPDPELCAAAGFVAIRDFSRQEIVLTYTTSRYSEDPNRKGAQWEIPGGHCDPLDPKRPHGPKEQSDKASAREGVEEAGFKARKMVPFAFRMVHNPPEAEQTGPKKYPPETYYAYYWAETDEGLILPTDPEEPLSGSFMADRLHRLVEEGDMDAAEYTIVMDGLDASMKYYGFN